MPRASLRYASPHCLPVTSSRCMVRARNSTRTGCALCVPTIMNASAEAGSRSDVAESDLASPLIIASDRAKLGSTRWLIESTPTTARLPEFAVRCLAAPVRPTITSSSFPQKTAVEPTTVNTSRRDPAMWRGRLSNTTTRPCANILLDDLQLNNAFFPAQSH